MPLPRQVGGGSFKLPGSPLDIAVDRFIQAALSGNGRASHHAPFDRHQVHGPGS
jgi:hypothetical protein